MKKNPSVDAALFPDVCLIDQIEVEEGRLHVVHTIHVRHVPKDGCFFAKPFDKVNSHEEYALRLKDDKGSSSVNGNTFLLCRERNDEEPSGYGYYIRCADDVFLDESSHRFARKDASQPDGIKYLNQLYSYLPDASSETGWIWKKVEDPIRGTDYLTDGCFFRIGGPSGQVFRFREPEEAAVPSLRETKEDPVSLYQILEGQQSDATQTNFIPAPPHIQNEPPGHTKPFDVPANPANNNGHFSAINAPTIPAFLTKKSRHKPERN